MRPSRDSLVVAAVLAAVVVLAYAAPLVGGATLVGRDHLTHTLPAKQFLADTLRDGRLPEWWSAVDLGVPFAANPNHSALYPPMWLVAVLPMPWGADLLLVLHVLFAGLGAAALATRLDAQRAGAITAGIAFMLAGFTTSTVVHGGPLITLAWMPWVAAAADRLATTPRLRPMLVLALAIAAALLAGDPSFAIANALLAASLALARAPRGSRLRALLLVAAAHVVACALAAVVLVPALLLATGSARAGGLSYDAATAWSMHPLRVLEWLVPDALGDPNTQTAHLARSVADASGTLRAGPSWALSAYVSIPVLALAAAAPRALLRPLGLIAGAFVLLALGRYTPLYRAYRAVMLPEHLVRYPEKYLGVAILLACVLAGVAWTTPRWQRSAIVAAALVGAALAGTLLVRTLAEPGALQPALDVPAGLHHAQTELLLALAVLGAAGALLWLARRRPALRHVALALVTLHLVGRAWSVLPTFDRGVLAHVPQILAGSPPARIARPTEHLTRPDDPLPAQARTLYEGAAPNVATRFGFSYVVGYDQGHSGRFEQWLPQLVRSYPHYGVELEIVHRDDLAGRTPLGTDEPFGPYAAVAITHRPRAFVAGSWRHGDDSLAGLDTVVLAGEGPTGGAPARPLSPCTLSSPRPEHVELQCNAPFEGYATLLDAWAPGWTATVDGAPAAIERADVLVRAVRVSAGAHVVRFDYATPGLRLGLWIAVVAWLLTLALLIVPIQWRR